MHTPAQPDSEPPEARPFLELGDDLPPDWQYQGADAAPAPRAPHLARTLPPEWPTPNPSAPESMLSELRPESPPARRRWVYTRPSWPQLLSMALGLAVILALMPQFLGLLGVSLRVVLLMMRVLALPLIALGLAWWGWQLWQYRAR